MLPCSERIRRRWGRPFLEESYLYHLHRLDHRHNFSPYFYLIYLTYPSARPSPAFASASAAVPPLTLWQSALRSPLVSFVPQMALSLGVGLLFARRRQDLVFAWFVQTCAFVLLNKVCTSQVRTLERYVALSVAHGVTMNSTSYGTHSSCRSSSPSYQSRLGVRCSSLGCG